MKAYRKTDIHTKAKHLIYHLLIIMLRYHLTHDTESNPFAMHHPFSFWKNRNRIPNRMCHRAADILKSKATHKNITFNNILKRRHQDMSLTCQLRLDSVCHQGVKALFRDRPSAECAHKWLLVTPHIVLMLCLNIRKSLKIRGQCITDTCHQETDRSIGDHLTVY